ncbi:MAG: sigma-70 family RNA polymerase sigma factor [Miltoncostaeaceae bacterium]
MAGFHDPETLFAAVAEGDPAAREDAIMRHIPLVRSIARRHLRPPETLDELVQVGTIALIGAVDRYNPHRGASFASFAVPTISGEIQRHYRDRVASVRLPRSILDTRRAALAAADGLRAEGGRDPGSEEIARVVGVDHAAVREAIESASLARPVPYWGEDGHEESPALRPDDGDFRAAEARADLAGALASLPARERVILGLRFSRDLTQSEIAARVGVSQMHVSRLLRRAIGRLRERLGADDEEAALAS